MNATFLTQSRRGAKCAELFWAAQARGLGWQPQLHHSPRTLRLCVSALSLFIVFTTLAAPLQWTCDWPEAKSQTFSLYQGETATFEPTFHVNGRTVTNATIEAVWYQTNGMGNAWWKLDGATFAPSNDVGAASYRFFVEASVPGSPFPVPQTIYRANGALRMLPSPGFTPNTIELPVATLDFANIEVANAPYYDKTETEAKIVELAPAPGDYANVSNKAVNAVGVDAMPTIEGYAFTNWHNKIKITNTDGYFSIGTNIVLQGAMLGGVSGGQSGSTRLFAGWNLGLSDTFWDELADFVAEADPTVPDWAKSETQPLPPDYSNVSNKAMNALQSYTESDPTISSWAKAAQKPTYTASEVGAASTNEVVETRQIVTTWENFLDGSNVVFSITNYLSGSYNLDAAKLRILELRDGEYQEVYNSRDEILLHIDDFSNRYVRVAIDAIVDEVAARLASKADRDWGKYTSAGGEAPSNTVYMTAPNTVFAGGLEYERVAVGEGTICVLTTRGAPVWTQGDEGTFKFQDDGGTNYFGFAKTDSYTIGANTDGITVQDGMVTMIYNITMSGRPCVWYKSSLSSGAWEQLNLPDGSPVAGASHAVTWEENPDPGTQVCYINVGNAPSGFFRATVEVTGEAKFMTNMPADLSGGIISTNTAAGVNGVVKPTFDGASVIWTWSANQ